MAETPDQDEGPSKLECFIRLDEFNYWLSRTRDLIASAETYNHPAFQESLRELRSEARKSRFDLDIALLEFDREKKRLHNANQQGQRRQRNQPAGGLLFPQKDCERFGPQEHGHDSHNGREDRRSGEPEVLREAASPLRIFSGQQANASRSGDALGERPEWHRDVETAKRECRTCLKKWRAQIERLRQLAEDSDAVAPDALRASFDELMPDLKRAAQATIARFQILLLIRAGEMRRHDEPPEEPPA